MTAEDEDRRPQAKPADADNTPVAEEASDELDRYSDTVTGHGRIPSVGQDTPAHFDSHRPATNGIRHVDKGGLIQEIRPGGVTVFDTKHGRDRTWG